MMTNLQISNAHGTNRLTLLHHNICVRRDSAPYPHLRMHPVLHPDDAARVLRWLQLSNSWRREMRSFSSHDSFALTPDIVPTEADPAVSPNLLRVLRNVLQSRLGVTLKSYSLIEAHRSIKQDHIGLHTDEGVNEVRVTLNLNSGWTESHGGILSLQDRPVHPRKRIAYCPVHNSATAFCTTETSYHQVSPIKVGLRYTLLYRFPIAPPTLIPYETAPSQTSPCKLPLALHTVVVVISDPYRWPAT